MLYDSEQRNLRVALTGDSLLTRPLKAFAEERFLQLRHLLQEADVAFTNFESCAHEYGQGTPALSKGTYMTTEPKLLGDLRWFGVNLASTANNHVFDWGEEGITLTMRNLEEAGILQSGIGRNLREATRPAYLDTQRGRVALISANSFYKEYNRATNQRVDAPGKPGVNMLDFRKSYVVDREAFEALRRIGANLAFDLDRRRQADFGFFSSAEIGSGRDNRYPFLGFSFLAGDGFEIHTSFNQQDADENLLQVREARRQADLVIFSLHNHELGGKSWFSATKSVDVEEPAEFMIEFAHRCIDEGVDIVVGHGPHIPLGIEIYKGKPIFYSLGHFIMQNETIQVLPSYAYDRFGMDPSSTPADFLDARSDSDRKAHPAYPLFWETVLATCQFKDGELKEVLVYPADLGFGRPRSQRGRPLLADEALGRKIISRLARLSRDFGTHIEYADGRGVVMGL